MPLSLLLQLLEGTQNPSKNELSALYRTADALTLRRLALLCTVERWENSKLQVELLEEVIRRDDPKELGIFLASSHLTKQLSRTGALGHALSRAAERGLVHAINVLACRATPNERLRAAFCAAENGKATAFEFLLKACRSQAEEVIMLKSCVPAAAANGCIQLLWNLITSLQCARVVKLDVPAALYACANRGSMTALGILLQEFEWSDHEILNAKHICDRNGSVFPEVANHDNSANDDDELKLPTLKSFSREALLEAAKQGSSSVITALLSLQTASVDDLGAALNVAAEQGHYQVFSRLYHQYSSLMSDSFRGGIVLSSGLVLASLNNRSDFVRRLAPKADDISQQRAFVHASSLGHKETLQALLKTCRLQQEEQFKEILTAGLVEGRTECVALLTDAHPQHLTIVEELARRGAVRAARLGDSKLADTSVSFLTTGNAGGAGTAAILLARKHGFDDVVFALQPLKRGVSQFTGVPSNFTELNDDVFDRVLSFLDLRSLSRCGLLCRRFSQRTRIAHQLTRSLISDYNRLRQSSSETPTASSLELLRLAKVLSSKSNPIAYEIESNCKAKAMQAILDTAIREDWNDLTAMCSELCICAADADAVPIVESLLSTKLSSGDFAVSPAVCQRVFSSTITKECLKSLMVICRMGLSSRRLGTRQLVDKVREESTSGNASTLSLLLASLSKEALTSRRERDALWARRRVEWERRGGIWGAMQQEEEHNQGRTNEERDFDDAISGALRRAGSNGHTGLLSSILKMLRARGRLPDFTGDYEKAFEGACRGGFDQTVGELLSFSTIPEPVQLEGLAIATRNAHTGLAKILVQDGHLPLKTIRSRFMESVRRGHMTAVQTFLATGAIGASVCADALEETVRRGHDDCTAVLKQAHERLVKFEEEEGILKQ